MTVSEPEISFVWNALPDWDDLVLSQLPKSIRKELLKTCRNRKTEFKYADDECFTRAFCSEFTDVEEILLGIANEMRSKYQDIRMFHCCRPVSVDSYYKDGIKTLDFNYANQLFRSIVRAVPDFSSVSTDQFKFAFDDMSESSGRNGVVYFGLDDRYLINCCPDYIQYGSEYFQALAVRVDCRANTNIKEYLRSNGKPTIFVVDIPLSDINSNEMESLVSDMLTTCLYNHSHGNSVAFENDFAISLTTDLKPDRIVRHSHPQIN